MPRGGCNRTEAYPARGPVILSEADKLMKEIQKQLDARGSKTGFFVLTRAPLAKGTIADLAPRIAEWLASPEHTDESERDFDCMATVQRSNIRASSPPMTTIEYIYDTMRRELEDKAKKCYAWSGTLILVLHSTGLRPCLRERDIKAAFERSREVIERSDFTDVWACVRGLNPFALWSRSNAQAN